MIKKHRLRSVLTAVLLFCLVCSCFLTFGHTSAYITDSSNTCVNTFSGETVTEPTTEPATEPTTQPTSKPETQPQTETTTVSVDTSPISPPTGGNGCIAAAGLACASALCIVICVKKSSKAKRR